MERRGDRYGEFLQKRAAMQQYPDRLKSVALPMRMGLRTFSLFRLLAPLALLPFTPAPGQDGDLEDKVATQGLARRALVTPARTAHF